jgi:hypothetical protein
MYIKQEQQSILSSNSAIIDHKVCEVSRACSQWFEINVENLHA